MIRVFWPDAAVDQLNEIVAYIALFDPAAAARISTRLFELGNSLAEFPERGRPATNGAREMVTVRPHILRYAFEDDLVTILGIRHSAQLSPD